MWFLANKYNTKQKKWFPTLNPSKTESLIFRLTHLPEQLSKLNNPNIHSLNNVILSPVDSVHNLVSSLIQNLSFAQHISAVSKSCFQNILDLRGSDVFVIQSLSLFLSPFVCMAISGLISGFDQASFFISHRSTCRHHSPSHHSRQLLCYLTCKCLWISSHLLVQLF